MRTPKMTLFLLPLLAAAALAQQPQQKPVPIIPGLSLQPHATQSAGKFVRLNVVVTAKNTPPIAGLQPGQFTILDNKTPQTITGFHEISGAQATAKVVLVIDTVNTRYDTIASARVRIDDFLRDHEGHLAQPTAFLNFTDTGMEGQLAFTDNGIALADTFDHTVTGLRFLNRSTGEVGAAERLGLSVNALHQLVVRLGSIPGRKLILWLSPGWPMLSSPEERSMLDYNQQKQIYNNAVNLITLMRLNDVTLYSVNPVGAEEGPFDALHYEEFMGDLTKPGQAVLGNLALQVFAERSGGLALNEGNDIAAMLHECVSDTRDWYAITYAPTDLRPEFHKITIKVSQPKTTARSQMGYYIYPETPTK